MTARAIVAVRITEKEAQKVADQVRGLGGQNVRVHREKVRAEQTWRWCWVVVADADAVPAEKGD